MIIGTTNFSKVATAACTKSRNIVPKVIVFSEIMYKSYLSRHLCKLFTSSDQILPSSLPFSSLWRREVYNSPRILGIRMALKFLKYVSFISGAMNSVHCADSANRPLSKVLGPYMYLQVNFWSCVRNEHPGMNVICG